MILQCSEGNKITVLLNASAVRDEQGRLLHSVSVMTDITERKHSEQLLASQLSELRKWQGLMMGREDRILELKIEVNELLKEMGQSPRYQSCS